MFSWMMLYDFFPDISKSLPFCKQRNISVHLSIKIYMIDNFTSVRFQTAIKVVQFYTGSEPGYSIKEAGRYGFGDGIVSNLFPAAYKVCSFFKHLNKSRYFLRIVL